jgi:hypothetical protein
VVTYGLPPQDAITLLQVLLEHVYQCRCKLPEYPTCTATTAEARGAAAAVLYLLSKLFNKPQHYVTMSVL